MSKVHPLSAFSYSALGKVWPHSNQIDTYGYLANTIRIVLHDKCLLQHKWILVHAEFTQDDTVLCDMYEKNILVFY